VEYSSKPEQQKARKSNNSEQLDPTEVKCL